MSGELLYGTVAFVIGRAAWHIIKDRRLIVQKLDKLEQILSQQIEYIGQFNVRQPTEKYLDLQYALECVQRNNPRRFSIEPPIPTEMEEIMEICKKYHVKDYW